MRKLREAGVVVACFGFIMGLSYLVVFVLSFPHPDCHCLGGAEPAEAESTT